MIPGVLFFCDFQENVDFFLYQVSWFLRMLRRYTGILQNILPRRLEVSQRHEEDLIFSPSCLCVFVVFCFAKKGDVYSYVPFCGRMSGILPENDLFRPRAHHAHTGGITLIRMKYSRFFWISGGIGFTKPAGLRIRLEADSSTGGFAIGPEFHPSKSD